MRMPKHDIYSLRSDDANAYFKQMTDYVSAMNITEWNPTLRAEINQYSIEHCNAMSDLMQALKDNSSDLIEKSKLVEKSQKDFESAFNEVFREEI